MNDYDVGYGKPPKEHQFKKGQSGNPKGRKPKEKKAPDRSLAAMLKRTGEREIDVAGEIITLQELELLALQKKAAKGDVAASRHLSKLREQAGLLKPNERPTGVLAVPMAIDQEAWEYLAARQQAKYRTSEPWNPKKFVLDPNTTDPYPVLPRAGDK